MNADESIESEATEELTAERMKEIRVTGMISIGVQIITLGANLIEISNSDDMVELSRELAVHAITLDGFATLMTKASSAVISEMLLGAMDITKE